MSYLMTHKQCFSEIYFPLVLRQLGYDKTYGQDATNVVDEGGFAPHILVHNIFLIPRWQKN